MNSNIKNLGSALTLVWALSGCGNTPDVTEVKIGPIWLSQQASVQQKIDSILNIRWVAATKEEIISGFKVGTYQRIEATNTTSETCRNHVTKTIVDQVNKRDLNDYQSRGLLAGKQDVQVWAYDYSDNFNSGTLLSAIQTKCKPGELNVSTGYSEVPHTNFVTVVTKTEAEGETLRSDLMEKLRTDPELKDVGIEVDTRSRKPTDYVIEYQTPIKSY